MTANWVITRIVVACVAIQLLGAAHAQPVKDATAPEAGTGIQAKKAVAVQRQIVVAAHPDAARAALDMLRAGGSAADALVAAQLVLGLVEPQSSGLGGGAFVLWFDASSSTIMTFDGRETAPASATPRLFLDEAGKPLSFFDAVVGGRSVGVPGIPRLLQTLHQRFGKKPWPDLFEKSIDLAESGFVVSDRLSRLIAEDAGRLDQEPSTRSYFFDKAGEPVKAGATLRNPAYAATLRAIASGGADVFYDGAIAADIVAAVNSHPTNPGKLSMDDMTRYQVKDRPAVCTPYRGLDVCGMGPPSSGALTIGQILGMVEPFDLATLGPHDPETWRIIGDATRLAFADRERFMADSDYVDVPKGLLNRQYLASRSLLIRRTGALAKEDVSAGEPPWDKTEIRRDRPALELPSTSHLVIVDATGNIASMTTSIENAFGARLMVDGFLLNNQLTDFAFDPGSGDATVANRVEPGKRPRSSMSPTIVLQNGKPVYALGSPGGSMIIPFVACTLVALIDWKMDMQEAISMPHLVNRSGRYDLEAGTWAESLSNDLQALGYETKISEINSGLHGVTIGPNSLIGGADPRRDGVAVGD